MDMVKENQFTGMDNVTITCSFGDSCKVGSLTSDLYYRPHLKDGEGTSFSLFVSSHLGRVAMAPGNKGKQEIWIFIFSRLGKHREFAKKY